MAYYNYLIRYLLILLIGLFISSVAAEAKTKPRLIVLTDISSIESGVREPDDAQSMIRLLLYSDDFDIQGLIASSGLGIHGLVVRPENIRAIVDAYAEDYPSLKSNSSGYPRPDQLRQVIKSGQPVAGRGVPVKQSIGSGKDTPASQLIIKTVDERDARPVWIVIWGGSADLAQALFTVRETRSPSEVARFASKIRVKAAVDQDSTGPWIKSQFPNLFYITTTGGGRGVYRQGDTSLVDSAWVQNNIKGTGALGAIYPDYMGGDIFTNELGPVRGIKSGDSSTFMGLIDNGLNDRNHLTWTNWGGRLKPDARNPRHFENAIDRVGNYQTDVTPFLAAVYRWRPDFQADLAARFEWTVKPYSQANHAPVDNRDPAITYRRIAAGENVSLQSGDWRDPDGNSLTYHWQILKNEGTYSKNIQIGNDNSSSAQFVAPAVQRPQSIHVLLTVTDVYYPALSSYKRVHFTLFPQ